MIALALYWRKKFIAIGRTCLVELTEQDLSFLYLGHAMAAQSLSFDRGSFLHSSSSQMSRAAGKYVASRMIAKYTSEAEANAKIYEDGGRDQLLANKHSAAINRSGIQQVTLLDKKGIMDPGLAMPPGSGLIDLRTRAGRWRFALKSGGRAETEAWASALDHQKI